MLCDTGTVMSRIYRTQSTTLALPIELVVLLVGYLYEAEKIVVIDTSVQVHPASSLLSNAS